MIQGNYNSIAFFRKYFHIPAGQKLAWALIRETVQGKSEIRLGLVFCQHPHVYLDVAMRRFFTVLDVKGAGVTREVYPAQRHLCKGVFCFVADNGLCREFPKNYIRDIYFTSVYSSEIFVQRLY